MHMPDIWTGSMGSFSVPTERGSHQYYNIHALRTRSDPDPTGSAVWFSADGPMCARLSSLGLWEPNAQGEPANTPQIVSRRRDMFSTTVQIKGKDARAQAAAWATRVKNADRPQTSDTQALGAWALTLSDAQNSILLRIHSSWKQEIIAAIQQIQEEDIDGYARVPIKCAFFGDTMILAAGQCHQEIHTSSNICKLVTQITLRHGFSDELIRHGHLWLSGWNATGQNLIADQVLQLKAISIHKQVKGPAELTHNLAGWISVVHALTSLQPTHEEEKQMATPSTDHQVPPGLSLYREAKEREHQQAGNDQDHLRPGEMRQFPKDITPNYICQQGTYQTLRKSRYTPILAGTRAADVSPRIQTAGVGTHIYGHDGTHWGKVIAEEQSAWRLAGGRIAKKKTEHTKWRWGQAHPSDFPDHSDYKRQQGSTTGFSSLPEPGAHPRRR